MPEFAKLAPEFDGKSSDPVDAENWVGRVEKAFAAFEIPDRKKMPMAEFQLKDDANVWWQNEKVNLPEPVDWNGFKVLFYKKYFPRTIRNQMLSQLWALKQGNRSVAEYEAEFNRLMKFAPGGIRDQELTNIQKFRDGLNLELQLDTQGHDGTTLGDLINKAKDIEAVTNKMKATR